MFHNRLTSSELMDHVLKALNNREPLSVVSVGATESYVMAQYTVLSEEEFMSNAEAEIANLGEKRGFAHRGVRFPNVRTRDDAVEAVRKADIVGYNTLVRWPNAGLLTERVFEAYDIKPKWIFDSYLRRVMMFSQKDKFEEMLRNRRLLLVGALADDAAEALNRNLRDRLGFTIAGTIQVDEYEEIPDAKRQIQSCEFDLCLLAAGTNALILASYISSELGKVALDLGSGMNSLITGQVFTDPWLDSVIGLDNLMKM
ncbi:hypothetical protein E5161_02445 [Cohnella pontilimi]|uniref:GT-D fold-like domain-containing protein n=1 Tax=Cohnella pontilimi TaxID=2564100 RepID=A0A4U0FH41_9BACL|nr:GT-D fold domain-containing glycosyltransferase [Cohnella pontilimi]TJY44267.1 hypothetical protein E5161_02445 [Cohnella pontilimi]